jgi:hypothetical protein
MIIVIPCFLGLGVLSGIWLRLKFISAFVILITTAKIGIEGETII